MNEIKLQEDLKMILKEEYTRTFECSKCGSKEQCVPAIVPDSDEGFIAIYGSGVDMCTHCSKWREKKEETTEFLADLDASEEGEPHGKVPEKGESESAV